MPWYDQLEALRAQPPDATPAELMEALKLRKSQVSDLQAIDKCFDLPALEKVRAAASPQQTGISSPSGTQKANNLPYTLSFRSALALAGLKKVKLADFNQTFHAALDVTLTLQLTTVQIVALVDWITKGNSPETFDPPEPGKKGKSYKGTKGKNQPTGNADDLKPVLELFKKVEAEIARGDGETAAQDELRALLNKGKAETQEDEDSDGKSSPKTNGDRSGISSPFHKARGSGTQKSASVSQAGWFWEMLLGVKFVSQLRSKAKKGELTTTDKVLVLLYWVVGKPLEFIFEHLGKLFKESAKDFWHWLKHTMGETLSKTIQWAIPLLIICALIWGAGKVYQYAIVNPLHWVESEIKSGFHWGGHSNEQPTPQIPISSTDLGQSTRAPQHEASGQMPTPKKITKPIIAYQPSIPFQPTAEDSAILEYEIGAMGPNSYVKDHSVTPDEGIPGDVAVSRMRDLADPDKYTMKIGREKQTLLSANVTTTGLTINYKSPDLFHAVTGDGGSQWNVLWEDINAIHVSEIVSETNGPVTYFQISAIADGAKIPFTLQCSTKANLQHLVSALEYFIRNSRLGHDAQPGGLPYPTQGLRLNNNCVVDKLWADSPADKVDLTLGDHVWSVGKISDGQQSRGDIEKGLTSSAILYVVSPAEWERALAASRVPGQALGFRPKLRKVVLTANQN